MEPEAKELLTIEGCLATVLEGNDRSKSNPQRCSDLENLRKAILLLPAVQAEIAAKARDLFLAASSPSGRAMDHWLAAEEEALLWIDAALACTSVSPRGPAFLTP